MKTRYIASGRDADHTTHVMKVTAAGEARIVATFNSWWNAIRYTTALNFDEAVRRG